MMMGGGGRWEGEEHGQVFLQQRGRSQTRVQRRQSRQRGREEAEGRRCRGGGSGGGSSCEKEGAHSFLPEIFLNSADDVVDEDAALQVEVGAHPRAVQLHERHVEHRLPLQSEGRLRRTTSSQRTAILLQTVLILVQFPLHPVTQHKSHVVPSRVSSAAWVSSERGQERNGAERRTVRREPKNMEGKPAVSPFVAVCLLVCLGLFRRRPRG